MRAFCTNCGSTVEVLIRRHWRFSSSVVPCPQFRHYICVDCKEEFSDSEVEKSRLNARKKKETKSAN
jgi:DNA-directed RNA polymerase subunit RPC12/RpoP